MIYHQLKMELLYEHFFLDLKILVKVFLMDYFWVKLITYSHHLFVLN